MKAIDTEYNGYLFRSRLETRDSMNSGVYIITNLESNKVYIGSTKDFTNRWSRHKSALQHSRHHNSHLQRSWDRYGSDCFEFGILEYLDNPEELHLAEQWWMDLYREEGKELYNHGLSARHNMLGMKRSEETKRKISETMTGRVLSDEHKYNLTGRVLSDEHRQKIGEYQKGRVRSEETRRKISKGLTGRKLSDEHRQKISVARQARFEHGETPKI